MKMKGIFITMSLLNLALNPRGCRLSAQELLECSFLAVEPDVVILENDPSHTIVTLQVVFKGSDKLSVKFEFNTVSCCVMLH